MLDIQLLLLQKYANTEGLFVASKKLEGKVSLDTHSLRFWYFWFHVCCAVSCQVCTSDSAEQNAELPRSVDSIQMLGYRFA